MPVSALTRLFSAAALLLAPAMARADADGPDFWRISLPQDQTLMLRAGPAQGHRAVGAIPGGADGAANFGCVGGLSMAQWQVATQAERDAAKADRWCRIGYGRMVGWVPGAALVEGGGPDGFNAGARLGSLDGSEWLARDFAGVPARAEAWVAFKDGTAAGHAGCNRFTTGYEEGPAAIAFPAPMAMTRMACPEDESATETAMVDTLAAAHGMVAMHLVLALFDADGVLLATFTRRDAE